MPSRRRSKSQRGFVAFPVDSNEFVSTNEGGLFVRLVVEYPPDFAPSTPSIRVVLDETFQGDDQDPLREGSYNGLPDSEVWAAVERNDRLHQQAMVRQFPNFGDIHDFTGRSSPDGKAYRAAVHRPLTGKDEDLGQYLAALSLPDGPYVPAAEAVIDQLGVLYRGFEHTRLGVPGSADIMVVEHAQIYEYDWPTCSGGSCVVVRRPDDPNRSPYLSVPYAAVILLGSTGWSGYSEQAGAYWIATYAEGLTDEGRRLYDDLAALYPAHQIRLTTWLDT